MEQEDFNIREHQLTSKERDFENALRPLSFEDFSGQDKVVENLRIFVKAARLRGEALDHVLLHGPPGLGKTTLSNIIANELGVGFKVTSGPVLDKPGDLAGVLTSLEPCKKQSRQSTLVLADYMFLWAVCLLREQLSSHVQQMIEHWQV